MNSFHIIYLFSLLNRQRELLLIKNFVIISFLINLFAHLPDALFPKPKITLREDFRLRFVYFPQIVEFKNGFDSIALVFQGEYSNINR